MFLSDRKRLTYLTTSSKSCPAHPVPASWVFYNLSTRDIPTPMFDSGAANPGVWTTGVITIPTAGHLPDGAYTAPGHSYGQGHEGVTT